MLTHTHTQKLIIKSKNATDRMAKNSQCMRLKDWKNQSENDDDFGVACESIEREKRLREEERGRLSGLVCLTHLSHDQNYTETC